MLSRGLAHAALPRYHGVCMPEGLTHLVDRKGSIVIDSRFLPILFVTFRGGSTEGLIRDYFKKLEALHRRLGPDARYVSITDAREASHPPAAVRKLVADLTEAHRDVWSRLVLRSLTVIDSAVIRGAFTAIEWISRRPFDIQMVASVSAALDEAARVLDEAGLPWPTGVRRGGDTFPTPPTD